MADTEIEKCVFAAVDDDPVRFRVAFVWRNEVTEDHVCGKHLATLLTNGYEDNLGLVAAVVTAVGTS